MYVAGGVVLLKICPMELDVCHCTLYGASCGVMFDRLAFDSILMVGEEETEKCV